MTTFIRIIPALIIAGAVVGTGWAQPRVGETPWEFEPSSIDSATGSTKFWAEQRFLDRHEEIMGLKEQGPFELVLLGDSITDFWRSAPEIWNAYFGKYRPANFGVSGDSTQHVIWRIEHGAFDGLSVKVVVLLLGTNNTAGHTAVQIAAGNRRIIDLLQEKIPGVKILLMGVWPRGGRHMPDNRYDDGMVRNEIIRGLNKIMSAWDNGSTVRYLDIGANFRDEHGKLRSDLLPDMLHPNEEGYRVWAEAIQPLLAEMME